MSLVRKYKSAFTGTAPLLAFCIGLMMISQQTLAYTSTGRTIGQQYIMGVDTIVVSRSFSGETWPPPSTPSTTPPPTQDSILQAVEEAFSNYPWIAILSRSPGDSDLQRKPNVITFQFKVTTQPEESIDGKAIQTASIGLTIRKMPPKPGDLIAVVPLNPMTYSFVVPRSSEERVKKVNQGVHFLIDHLPSDFPCPKDKQDVSGNCPPTGKRPYGEKPPVSSRIYKYTQEKNQ